VRAPQVASEEAPPPITIQISTKERLLEASGPQTSQLRELSQPMIASLAAQSRIGAKP